MEQSVQEQFYRASFQRTFLTEDGGRSENDDSTTTTTENQEKAAALDLMASLDPKLIKLGQEFFEKNFAAISFLTVMSHVIILYPIKSVLAILLRTGTSMVDTKLLFLRSLRTLLYIMRWYRCNFSENPAAAIEKIFSIRRTHRLALRRVGSMETPLKQFELGQVTREDFEEAQILAKAIRDDLAHLDVEGPKTLLTFDPMVPFSQLDMACVQSFYVLMVKWCPQSFGIGDTQGLEGFLHFWAVIGRGLGLHDHFNVALRMDGAKSADELCNYFVKTIIFGSWKECDYVNTILQKKFTDMLTLLPFKALGLSQAAWTYFCMSALSSPARRRPGGGGGHEDLVFEGKNIKSLMTWRDHFILKSLRIILFLWANVGVLRRLANYATEKLIMSASRMYLPELTRARGA